MSKRRKLLVNIILITILILLALVSTLLYINYYPRVLIHLIDGEALYDTIQIKKNSSVPALKSPSKDGYIFEGWFNDQECTDAFQYNVAITEDMEVYAKYTAIDYTLTYNVEYNGQTYRNIYSSSVQHVDDSISTYYGTEIIVLDEGNYTLSDLKTGYHFIGWADAPGSTSATVCGAGGTFLMPARDVDLYAVWAPNEYPVVYYTQNLSTDMNVIVSSDGSVVYNDYDQSIYASVDYKYSKLIEAPEAPTNADGYYQFVGWYLDKDFTKLVIFGDTRMGLNYLADSSLNKLDGASTPTFLYAKWQVVRFNILYCLNKDSRPATIFKADDSSILQPVNGSVTNTDYFIPKKGYYYNSMMGNIGIYDNSQLEGKVYYSSKTNIQSHKFLGWYTEKDGGKQYTSSTNFNPADFEQYYTSEDLGYEFLEPNVKTYVLYAHWEEYLRISYVYNGKEYDYQSVTEDQTIKLMNVMNGIEKKGYYFAGWTLDKNQTDLSKCYTVGDSYRCVTNAGSAGDNTIYFANGGRTVIMYPYWKANAYKIEYNFAINVVDNDNKLTTIEQNPQGIWYSPSLTVQIELSHTEVVHYNTKTAGVWEKHIVFNALTDGVSNASYTANDGAVYLLSGWALIDNNTNKIIKTYNDGESKDASSQSTDIYKYSVKENSENPADGNYIFTISALWKKQITVKFDKGYNEVEGEVPADISIMNGNSIIIPSSSLTRPYHTFKGWVTDDQRTTADGSENYTPTTIYKTKNTVKFEDNTTLYASWEPIEYSLHLYNTKANGSNGTKIVTVKMTYQAYKTNYTEVSLGQTITYGTSSSSVTIPEGYSLDGFSRSVGGEVVYEIGDKIKVSTTYPVEKDGTIVQEKLFDPTGSKKIVYLYAKMSVKTYTVSVEVRDKNGDLITDIDGVGEYTEIKHDTKVKDFVKDENIKNRLISGLDDSLEVDRWKISGYTSKITDIATENYLIKADTTITLYAKVKTFSVTMNKLNPLTGTIEDADLFDNVEYGTTLEDALGDEFNVDEYFGFVDGAWYVGDAKVDGDYEIKKNITAVLKNYVAKNIQVVYSNDVMENTDNTAKYNKEYTLKDSTMAGFAQSKKSLTSWTVGGKELGKVNTTLTLNLSILANILSLEENDVKALFEEVGDDLKLNLVAVYKDIFTITFVKADNSTLSGETDAQKYVDGESIDLIALLDKITVTPELGFAFNGVWEISGTDTQIDLSDKTYPYIITSNIELKPVIEEGVYTFEFKAQYKDGSTQTIAEETGKKINDSITMPSDVTEFLTHNGVSYRAVKWYLSHNNNKTYNLGNSITVTTDLLDGTSATIVVMLQLNEIKTFTYNPKKTGETPVKIEACVGDTIKVGYKDNAKINYDDDSYSDLLTGWTIGGTDYNIGAEYTITDSTPTTFYGVWTQKTITVVYHRNTSATDETTYSDTIKYNESKQILSAVVMGFNYNNYQLTSWTTEQNGSGDTYSTTDQLQLKMNGEFHLYAQWTRVYTIIYQNLDDNKTYTDTNVALDGQEYTLLNSVGTFTKTGHYISGWSYDGTTYNTGKTITISTAEVVGAENNIVTSEISLTFTAVWSANALQITINYTNYDGTNIDNNTINTQYGETKKILFDIDKIVLNVDGIDYRIAYLEDQYNTKYYLDDDGYINITNITKDLTLTTVYSSVLKLTYELTSFTQTDIVKEYEYNSLIGGSDNPFLTITDIDGSSSIASAIVLVGWTDGTTNYRLPLNSTANGYNYAERFADSFNITSNVTLKPIILKKYTISVYKNLTSTGGFADKEDYTMVNGDKIDLPKGSEYVGFVLSSNGTYVYNPNASCDITTTTFTLTEGVVNDYPTTFNLYLYPIKNITISFSVGGETIDTYEIRAGETVYLPDGAKNYTNENNFISGWHIDGSAITFDSDGNSETKLYANTTILAMLSDYYSVVYSNTTNTSRNEDKIKPGEEYTLVDKTVAEQLYTAEDGKELIGFYLYPINNPASNIPCEEYAFGGTFTPSNVFSDKKYLNYSDATTIYVIPRWKTKDVTITFGMSDEANSTGAFTYSYTVDGIVSTDNVYTVSAGTDYSVDIGEKLTISFKNTDNKNVVVTITADTTKYNCNLTSWDIDDLSITTGGSFEYNNGQHNIEFNYTTEEVVITIKVMYDGKVVTSPNDNYYFTLEGDATKYCSYQYTYSGKATINVTAYSGYGVSFWGWYEGDTYITKNETYEKEYLESATLYAKFSQITPEIKFGYKKTEKEGTITLNDEEVSFYDSNSSGYVYNDNRLKRLTVPYGSTVTYTSVSGEDEYDEFVVKNPSGEIKYTIRYTPLYGYKYGSFRYDTEDSSLTLFIKDEPVTIESNYFTIISNDGMTKKSEKNVTLGSCENGSLSFNNSTTTTYFLNSLVQEGNTLKFKNTAGEDVVITATAAKDYSFNEFVVKVYKNDNWEVENFVEGKISVLGDVKVSAEFTNIPKATVNLTIEYYVGDEKVTATGGKVSFSGTACVSPAEYSGNVDFEVYKGEGYSLTITPSKGNGLKIKDIVIDNESVSVSYDNYSSYVLERVILDEHTIVVKYEITNKTTAFILVSYSGEVNATSTHPYVTYNTNDIITDTDKHSLGSGKVGQTGTITNLATTDDYYTITKITCTIGDSTITLFENGKDSTTIEGYTYNDGTLTFTYTQTQDIVITVTVESKMVNLTFKNGQNTVGNKDVAAGAPVTEVPTVDDTDTQYFIGWTYGDNLDFEDGKTYFTADTTLTAKFANFLKATYVDAKVEKYNNTKLKAGNSFTLATETEAKELYAEYNESKPLIGFTVNGVERSFGYTITDITTDITIEARYSDTETTVTVTLLGYNNAEFKKITESINKTLDLNDYGTPDIATGTDGVRYKFVGWLYDDKVITQIEVTADITINSKWEMLKEYNIINATDSGTTQVKSGLASTDTFTVEDPTKEGSTFISWNVYYKVNGSKTGETTIYKSLTNTTLSSIFNNIDDIDIDDNNIYIEAQFSSNVYDVTFSADTEKGSVSSDRVNVYHGQMLIVSGDKITINTTTIIATPKDGYAFDYWEKDGEKITDDDDIKITDDTEITAIFIETHTLTFIESVIYGGASNKENVFIVKDGTEISIINNKIKFSDKDGNNVEITATANTGYTFDGWYGKNDNKIENTLTITADTEITARFNIITYTVTFSAEDGSIENTTTNYSVNYGTTLSVNDNKITFKDKDNKDVTIIAEAYSGYAFDKWDYTTGTQITADTTIKAKFVKLYSVTYVDAKDETHNKTIKSGGSVDLVSKDIATTLYNLYNDNGQELAGFKDGTGAIYDFGETINNITTDISIYPRYADTKATFTVTFSADTTKGSVSSTTITVEYGTTLTLSGKEITINSTKVTATAVDGYAFDKWTKDSSTITAITITENTTITANFIKTHTLTFIVNDSEGGSVDGSNSVARTVKNGTKITVINNKITFKDKDNEDVTITATANAGYTFKKWSHSNDFTITKDTEIAAYFEANSYNVTVGAGDGGSISTGTKTYEIKYNSTISVSGDTLSFTDASGNSVIITATPNTGYNFSGFVIDTNTSFAGGKYTYTEAKTITATFTEKDKVTLNINISGGVNGYKPGKVTIGETDYTTSTNISGVYPVDQTITFTVTANTGFTLTSVTFNGENITPDNGSYTVTLTGSSDNIYTVDVVFEADTTNVSIKVSSDSELISSFTPYITYDTTEGTTEVTKIKDDDNNDVIYWVATGDYTTTGETTLTLHEAYEIDSVEGATHDGNTITYTFGANDITITVTLKLKKLTVTFTAEDGGLVGPTTSFEVRYNAPLSVYKNGISTEFAINGYAFVTAPPNTGYEFVGWYIGDTEITDDKISITKDTMITAKFKIAIYTIKFLSNDETMGTVDIDTAMVKYGTSTFNDNKITFINESGSKQTITATANPGYKFVGWYDYDMRTKIDKAEEIIQNTRIYAKFEASIVDFYINITTKAGNSETKNDGKGGTVTLPVSGTPANSYSSSTNTTGDEVTFTLTAESGFTLTSVTFNGENITPDNDSYTVTLTGSSDNTYTVDVVFNAVETDVSIKVIGEELNSEHTPYLTYGTTEVTDTNSHKIATGAYTTTGETEITIGDAYEFVSVTGGGEFDTETNTLSYEFGANDITITVTLKLKKLTVIFTNESGGVVGSTPSGSPIFEVDYGAELTLSDKKITINGTKVTATANDGYAFDSWYDKNGNKIENSTLTITEDTEIIASFVRMYTVKYVAGENGLVSYSDGYESNTGEDYSCTVSINSIQTYYSIVNKLCLSDTSFGDDYTIWFIANKNYEIDSITYTVNGVSYELGTTLSIDGDTTITCTFKKVSNITRTISFAYDKHPNGETPKFTLTLTSNDSFIIGNKTIEQTTEITDSTETKTISIWPGATLSYNLVITDGVYVINETDYPTNMTGTITEKTTTFGFKLNYTATSVTFCTDYFNGTSTSNDMNYGSATITYKTATKDGNGYITKWENATKSVGITAGTRETAIVYYAVGSPTLTVTPASGYRLKGVYSAEYDPKGTNTSVVSENPQYTLESDTTNAHITFEDDSIDVAFQVNGTTLFTKTYSKTDVTGLMADCKNPNVTVGSTIDHINSILVNGNVVTKSNYQSIMAYADDNGYWWDYTTAVDDDGDEITDTFVSLKTTTAYLYNITTVSDYDADGKFSLTDTGNNIDYVLYESTFYSTSKDYTIVQFKVLNDITISGSGTKLSGVQDNSTKFSTTITPATVDGYTATVTFCEKICLVKYEKTKYTVTINIKDTNWDVFKDYYGSISVEDLEDQTLANYITNRGKFSLTSSIKEEHNGYWVWDDYTLRVYYDCLDVAYYYEGVFQTTSGGTLDFDTMISKCNKINFKITKVEKYSFSLKVKGDENRFMFEEVDETNRLAIDMSTICDNYGYKCVNSSIGHTFYFVSGSTIDLAVVKVDAGDNISLDKFFTYDQQITYGDKKYVQYALTDAENGGTEYITIARTTVGRGECNYTINDNTTLYFQEESLYFMNLMITSDDEDDRKALNSALGLTNNYYYKDNKLYDYPVRESEELTEEYLGLLFDSVLRYSSTSGLYNFDAFYYSDNSGDHKFTNSITPKDITGVSTAEVILITMKADIIWDKAEFKITHSEDSSITAECVIEYVKVLGDLVSYFDSPESSYYYVKSNDAPWVVDANNKWKLNTTLSLWKNENGTNYSVVFGGYKYGNNDIYPTRGSYNNYFVLDGKTNYVAFYWTTMTKRIYRNVTYYQYGNGSMIQGTTKDDSIARNEALQYGYQYHILYQGKKENGLGYEEKDITVYSYSKKNSLPELNDVKIGSDIEVCYYYAPWYDFDNKALTGKDASGYYNWTREEQYDTTTLNCQSYKENTITFTNIEKTNVILYFPVNLRCFKVTATPTSTTVDTYLPKGVKYDLSIDQRNQYITYTLYIQDPNSGLTDSNGYVEKIWTYSIFDDSSKGAPVAIYKADGNLFAGDIEGATIDSIKYDTVIKLVFEDTSQQKKYININFNLNNNVIMTKKIEVQYGEDGNWWLCQYVDTRYKDAAFYKGYSEYGIGSTDNGGTYLTYGDIIAWYIREDFSEYTLGEYGIVNGGSYYNSYYGESSFVNAGYIVAFTTSDATKTNGTIYDVMWDTSSNIEVTWLEDTYIAAVLTTSTIAYNNEHYFVNGYAEAVFTPTRVTDVSPIKIFYSRNKIIVYITNTTITSVGFTRDDNNTNTLKIHATGGTIRLTLSTNFKNFNSDTSNGNYSTDYSSSTKIIITISDKSEDEIIYI